MSESHDIQDRSRAASFDVDERVFVLAHQTVSMALVTLYAELPFLDSALYRLRFEPDTSGHVTSWATNGRTVLYNPRHVLRRFRDIPTAVAHDILHEVLHCVFVHMFVNPDIDQRFWNLASDIAVEALIASFRLPSLDDGGLAERDAHVSLVLDLPATLTAESIIHTMYDTPIGEVDLQVLEALYAIDDHPWYPLSKDGPLSEKTHGEKADKQCLSDSQTDGTGAASSDSGGDDMSAPCEAPEHGQPLSDEEAKQLRRELDDDAKRVAEALAHANGKGQHGYETASLEQALSTLTRKRYDYKGFLRDFCTWGEAMRINDEEFDYVYYTFGLDTYGDTPLVEPLEYQELKRLRDIAIVLDTSGSVQGAMLQRFFERTYDLIDDESNAFKRFRIHLIQCDAKVKDDTVIHNRDELVAALEKFHFKGLGGTDFRPAFDYIDELVEQGAFINFKGVIYFTDGRGTFPEKAPAYKSAFVFLEDDYKDVKVPTWAIKLVLTQDEARVL